MCVPISDPVLGDPGQSASFLFQVTGVDFFYSLLTFSSHF